MPRRSTTAERANLLLLKNFFASVQGEQVSCILEDIRFARLTAPPEVDFLVADHDAAFIFSDGQPQVDEVVEWVQELVDRAGATLPFEISVIRGVNLKKIERIKIEARA